MAVQPVAPRPRLTLGRGSVIGFLCLALALYWLAILFNLLPERPQLVAITFLFILVVQGLAGFGF